MTTKDNGTVSASGQGDVAALVPWYIIASKLALALSTGVVVLTGA